MHKKEHRSKKINKNIKLYLNFKEGFLIKIILLEYKENKIK
jgi:hypothetical protein